MNLAKKIMSLRVAYKLSQEQLAEKLGVEKQIVLQWETGKLVPEQQKITQLCEMFDVTEEYLFADTAVRTNKLTNIDSNYKENKVQNYKTKTTKKKIIIFIFIIVIIPSTLFVGYKILKSNDILFGISNEQKIMHESKNNESKRAEKSDVTNVVLYTTQYNQQIKNNEPKIIVKSDVTNSVLYTTQYNDGLIIYAAFEIKNTGNVPIKINGISFDIEDENGNFITSFGENAKANPNIIEPGEKSYVCDDMYDTNNEIEKSKCKKQIINYEISQTNEIKKEYIVESVKIIDSSVSFWGISGRVYNNTNESVNRVVISAALFNKSNKFLGVINELIFNQIEAGSKRGFNNSYCVINKSLINKNDISRIVTIATNPYQ